MRLIPVNWRDFYAKIIEWISGSAYESGRLKYFMLDVEKARILFTTLINNLYTINEIEANNGTSNNFNI